MHFALPFSILLHASLLGWAMISFSATPPLKIPEVQPVEVAIISPDELVRLRKGDRQSKKLETRQAKPAKKTKPTKKKAKVAPKRAVEPPRSTPPPQPAETIKVEKTPPKPKSDDIAKKLASLQPLPKPGPTPEQLKAQADAKRKAEEVKQKAAAEKKAAAKKKAEAKKKKAQAKRKAAQKKKRLERKRKLAEKRRRARKKKKKFDPDKLAALLNKIPDKSSPPAGANDPPKKKRLPKGPRAGAVEGKDQRLTASQRSLLGVMMKRAVKDCWHVQTGIAGADSLVVEIEIRLHQTGELKGNPRVLNRRSDPIFRDAATNALRALKQCEPYNLPRDLYKGGWDHMVVTFDPQRMF